MLGLELLMQEETGVWNEIEGIVFNLKQGYMKSHMETIQPLQS